MRVAVRRIDRGAALAGLRRALDLAGPEGERLTACAGKHDRALAEPRHLHTRDRPGVGPGPGLHGRAGRQRLRERALEQDLRQHRLGVDPDVPARSAPRRRSASANASRNRRMHQRASRVSCRGEHFESGRQSWRASVNCLRHEDERARSRGWLETACAPGESKSGEVALSPSPRGGREEANRYRQCQTAAPGAVDGSPGGSGSRGRAGARTRMRISASVAVFGSGRPLLHGGLADHWRR